MRSPIIVVEADDRQAFELAIIENVQRSDLNPLEEASGYERLGAEFNYSHGDVAKVIGKSRSHVANSLRLLKLPDLTRRMLAEGHISAGHARALLSAPDPDALAVKIAAQGLSVRDIENILQSDGEGGGKAKSRAEGEGKGRQHALAGDLALGRAWAEGHDRRHGRARRIAHRLQDAGAARWADPAAAAGVGVECYFIVRD